MSNYNQEDIIRILDKSYQMLKKVDKLIEDIECDTKCIADEINGLDKVFTRLKLKLKLNKISDVSTSFLKETKRIEMRDCETLISLLFSVLHGEPLKDKEIEEIEAIEKRQEQNNG